jgi:hypothetical protein
MEDKKKYPYGSVMLEGKKIPLTKNGLPNQVFLSKVAKIKVKQLNETLKETKKAATEKEINDLFKSLGLI